jgi:hypothetical protein
MYCYNYEDLKKLTQTERGQKLFLEAKAEYEKYYANKPIHCFNYSLIKLYYQTGDREKHEKETMGRRNTLYLLQVLSLFDDKYLDLLENIISVICDQFTWVLPAHNYVKEDNSFDYTVIDLYSAEMGLYLAETVYIFGDKLSVDIRKRIKISLEQKIVKNYESRTFVFDGLNNNWAAVCAGGVGAMYLYAFPERFPLIEQRIFATLERYLNSVDEEGYTGEGMSYWLYGFGYFCVFFDIYHQLTGKWHKLLDLDKVKNAVKYFNNASLGGGEFLPYADGGSSGADVNPCFIYSVKNLFPDIFVLPYDIPVGHSCRALGARTVYGRVTYVPEKLEENKTVFYNQKQVFIHTNNEYSFTAKGGCNHEPHGHLCVGAFHILKNGKRYIVDPGAGEYTYGYFKIWDDSYEGRYGEKIFVCSSLAHSVPIINGKPQPYNLRDDKAVVLEQTDTTFKLDISKVYGDKTDGIIVEYTVLEKGVKVNYTCKGIEKATFRFVSEYKPTIKGNQTMVEELTINNNSNLTAKISEKQFSNHHAMPTTLYLIDYEVVGSNVETEFTFEF